MIYMFHPPLPLMLQYYILVNNNKQRQEIIMEGDKQIKNPSIKNKELYIGIEYIHKMERRQKRNVNHVPHGSKLNQVRRTTPQALYIIYISLQRLT